MKYSGLLSKRDAVVLQHYAAKAPRILEFGAGGSTQIFAQCAPGTVLTLDTNPHWIDQTKASLKALKVPPGRVAFRLLPHETGPSLDAALQREAAPRAPYHLVFNDGASDHEMRLAFARAAWPLLAEGGALLTHDTRLQPDIGWLCTFLAEHFATVGRVYANHRDSNITVVIKRAPLPYEPFVTATDWRPEPIMPTVHLLGLAHTITRPEFSKCPFTGNLLRFPKMLKPFGYKCIHYGVEGAQVPGAECVAVTSAVRFRLQHKGHSCDPRSEESLWIPEVYELDKPAAIEHQKGIVKALLPRLSRGDIVCFPFGRVHERVLAKLPPDVVAIETGIGYEQESSMPFQVFVSNAWYSWHRGRARNMNGDYYKFVIGNSFDVDEWTVRPIPKKGYVLYLGRCNEDKGMRIIYDLAAARPDLQFVLCGQGATFWAQLPNMKALPQVWGKERNTLFAGAQVVLMPSLYLEAFGNVCAEAQLCGRPVLSTPWGAFPEILAHGVAGYHCRTLGDFLKGLELAPTLSPKAIRAQAVAQFSLPVAGAKYHAAFQQCQDLLAGPGWASRTPHWINA
jgi:glycosyltransferase involved in cell wall biosynthesis